LSSFQPGPARFLFVAAAAVSRASSVWGQEASAPRGVVATESQSASQSLYVFFGGWVGLLITGLILALSLTAAYLVFEQLMTIRRGEIMPEGLGDKVRQLLQRGAVAEADRACRAAPSFLSFVLLRGLAEIEGGWSAVEKAMEDAMAEQSARLLRKIEYLSVIGNIAPMLGLLGTVTGMILAFYRVAATQGSAGAADLAEGIYQALVTTVAGLVVAIPCLGAFAILRNRVDQLVAEAAYLAQHACAPLKRRKPAHRASPAPSPPPVDKAS
jgi:biopolymer transport protein ExbB